MFDQQSFKKQAEFLILGAAVKTGLIDALSHEPQTSEQLALLTGTDKRALSFVVNAMVELGYFKYDNGKIDLSSQARLVFYDKDNPYYTGFSFMHFYNLISKWLELPDVLKSGRPVERKGDIHETRNYIAAMRQFGKYSAPEIVEWCMKSLPANPHVLDVGGGPLTYARVFAEKGARVTVLDLPEVVDMVKEELDSDMAVNLIKGDLTKGLPEGPFDMIYLANVCHIYGENENRKLFKEAANELHEGGKLVINDIIGGTGPFAAVFAVNMLVNTPSGGTWTYEQYKGWLQDAGFSVAPYEEIAGNQLIAATKQ